MWGIWGYTNLIAMKIGFVTGAYYPAPGGVSTSVESFRKNLTELGHRVTVFCPRYQDYDDHERDYVVRIPSYQTGVIPDFRLSDPVRARMTFRRQFSKLDVVHIHLPTLMSGPARAEAHHKNIPRFATYHTHLEQYLGHYIPLMPDNLARGLTRLYLAQETTGTERIFVPSKDIEQVVRGYGLEPPIEVLPSGVDVEFYRRNRSSVRSRYGLNSDSNLLLYVGRIGSEKNVQFLLEAFETIADRHPQAHLVVVGGGRGLSRLKQAASDLKLSNRIHFSGYIDDSDVVAAHYQSADLFVFASVTETQGLVLSESLASGTPVVAVDGPGIRDVLKDGQGGYLVPEDKEQFADSVNHLLSNPALLASKAKEAESLADDFSAIKMAKTLVEHYRRAI